MALANSILVTGLGRNIAKNIDREIQRIELAFKDVTKVWFLIVESDSDDDTTTVLKDLAKRNSNFDFISLGNLQDQIPDRITRIAYCRNVYMQEMRKNTKYKDVEFVCMIDFDLSNDQLTSVGIESCFTNSDWCGLFANQSGAYYDIYALRAAGWSENNCWKSFEILQAQGLNPRIAQQISVHSKKRRIKTDADWIPVQSAFGGLGIYKKECIKNLSYSVAEVTSSGDCEHVLFNNQLTRSGHKLFINPALVNFSWNEHNTSEKFKFSFKRKVKVLIDFFCLYL